MLLNRSQFHPSSPQSPAACFNVKGKGFLQTYLHFPAVHLSKVAADLIVDACSNCTVSRPGTPRQTGGSHFFLGGGSWGFFPNILRFIPHSKSDRIPREAFCGSADCFPDGPVIHYLGGGRVHCLRTPHRPAQGPAVGHLPGLPAGHGAPLRRHRRRRQRLGAPPCPRFFEVLQLSFFIFFYHSFLSQHFFYKLWRNPLPSDTPLSSHADVDRFVL